MIKNSNSLFYFTILFLLDIVLMIFVFEIVGEIRENLSVYYLPQFSKYSLDEFLWIILIILFMLIFENIYFIRYDFWTDLKKILKSLLFSLVTVFTVIILAKTSDNYSRLYILLFFAILAFVLPLGKIVIKKILFKFDFFRQKVTIIGDSKQSVKLTNEFQRNWYLGSTLSLNKNYDIAIVVSSNYTLKELEEIINKALLKTKDIYVVPYLNNTFFTQSDTIEFFNIRVSAIHIENRLLNYKNIAIKYFFEKLFTILISPIVLLIHAILSILIKLDSKGSILFKQKRLGQNRKIYTCYKYRTMYENSSKILSSYLEKNPDEVEYYNKYHKYKNDPRVTKIGKVLRKTSLDEFPQFYNILKGNMNLIGPRPYMVEENDKIGEDSTDSILKVKPGITGLWQVSGRNELDFKERVELDVWYIKNWSLWIDFIILIKTFIVLVNKKGAK